MPDNAAPLILLTRPLAQAERYGAALMARFGARVTVTILPLQQIVPVPLAPLPEETAAVIFTSVNGVAAAAEAGVAPMRAYCVGDATAQAARARGYDPRSAKGDVADLRALIAADAPQGRLIHLHGRQVRGDLVADLTAAGLTAEGRVIYDQEPLPKPPGWADALSHPGPLLAPLFSPRSATLFAACLGDDRPPQLILPCLSPAVAAALPPRLRGQSAVAATPSAEALTTVLARHISP